MNERIPTVWHPVVCMGCGFLFGFLPDVATGFRCTPCFDKREFDQPPKEEPPK
jgi:hypothetical protein